MSDKPNNRVRLLRLLELLQNETDENHLMTVPQICDELEKRYAIKADRKSVYSDIEALRECGYDISNFGGRRGFCFGKRLVEPSEARLLSDAVFAANFISADRARKIQDSVFSVMSVYDRENLKSQVYVDSHPKISSAELYRNIELVSRAICEKKKIKFSYVKHIIGEHGIEEKSRIFIVSPYALIWSNDRYYMICNYAKYDNLMHNRMDLVRAVQISSHSARPYEELPCSGGRPLDVAEYAKKSINMFSGEQEEITLRCANELLGEIYDKFCTPDVKISRDKNFPKTFDVSARVVISEGLAGWIMQFGNKIKVLKPQSLIDMIANRASDICSIYEHQ